MIQNQDMDSQFDFILGYNYVKTKVTDSSIYGSYSSNTSFSGLGYGLGAGINYFVTKNVGFDFGLNYSGADLKNSSTDTKLKTNGFNIGVGVNVFL